jgi:heme-degrading monooxygenase HmoA
LVTEGVVSMHARLSFVALSRGGDPDAAVRSFASSADAIQSLEGNQGFLLLVDRETNTGLTITFWDTEEHLRSSADEAARLRQFAAAIANVTIEDVRNYEVVIQKARLDGRPGASGSGMASGG